MAAHCTYMYMCMCMHGCSYFHMCIGTYVHTGVRIAIGTTCMYAFLCIQRIYIVVLMSA